MNLAKFILFLFISFLISCSNYGQLTFVTKLPKKLDENSGIIYAGDSKIWVIEDAGNADKIYQVDFEGNLLAELSVTNAENRDWEDLAKDAGGNLFIGDFGNNENKRKDLRIYKIPAPNPKNNTPLKAQIIAFHYPEQKKYPPKKENRRFDVEAFFYNEGSLFLFTKNRARPFDGMAQIYRIPAEQGSYEAQLIGELKTCEKASSCVITGADISPDGKKIALLGYGKLWVLTDFNPDKFGMSKIKAIDLGATTQLESICFENDSTLLLSDEQSHGTGRNLYRYTINK